MVVRRKKKKEKVGQATVKRNNPQQMSVWRAASAVLRAITRPTDEENVYFLPSSRYFFGLPTLFLNHAPSAVGGW